MYAMISEGNLTTILVATIAAVPLTLTAYWSRGAKKNSQEARADSAEAKKNSAEAKENSAQALHEVSTNGGMSDPNPNLNDHVKYQTEMTEFLVRSHQALDRKFDAHLKHSAIMDQALAELYLKDRPPTMTWPEEDLPQPPPV